MQLLSEAHCGLRPCIHPAPFREAPAQEKHGSNGLCPNSRFDFGNGYFDDYYGQTLFLDCILMDIMIYNGEIWCKLSALEMVYIH